jgi:hypothetical protein
MAGDLDAARMKRIRQIIISLLTVMLSVSVMAAPDGYSINSDSDTADSDSLFLLNLSTGAQTWAGKVLPSAAKQSDIESLAISPEGTLYGIDDQTLRLFPISMTTGVVDYTNEVDITNFGSPGFHDAGMTFTCSGDLYITRVEPDTSLYRLELDGTATLIGEEGALGAKISSIAAYGNTGKLYGLSNGEDADGGSIRQLYSIDMTTGVASAMDSSLGDDAGDYTESGLAFDEDGVLWAITDRRKINGIDVRLPSQILTIDTTSGVATKVSETTEFGFESLAISAPSGCEAQHGQPIDRDDLELVPTLNPAGILLISLVLLITGLTALRRLTV